MRILLVEDYAVLRDAVEGRLRQDGYAVDATGDGGEGLWLARENPYALAILDLTLPNAALAGGSEEEDYSKILTLTSTTLTLQATDVSEGNYMGATTTYTKQ